MQVSEALLVEGKPEYAILCYGIFRSSDLDTVRSTMLLTEKPERSEIYILFDDEWQNCVLLVEVYISNSGDIKKSISDAFLFMFKSGNCLAALCIYDGGFMEYKDIFGLAVANQIYAFSFAEHNEVINLDADLLCSDEWALIISRCRKRLDSLG